MPRVDRPLLSYPNAPGVNETAEWEIPARGRQSNGHGISFDDSQTEDVQLAFYFAVDRCSADYLAIIQLDQFPVGDRLKNGHAVDRFWIFPLSQSLGHTISSHTSITTMSHAKTIASFWPLSDQVASSLISGSP